MLIIKVPTSITEAKEFWNTHKSKRAINNRDVIIELKKDVFNVLKDSYWQKDISQCFRDNMNTHGELHLMDCFNNAIKKLR